MRVRRRAAMVAVALATLPAACGGGGSGTTPAASPGHTQTNAPGAASLRPRRLRFHDCAKTPALPGFRCATLHVPVHRRGPQATDTLTLALEVAVQAVEHPPKGDFLLLAGGPGQPGRPFGPRMVRRLGSALEGYRLVLLDQRGTGGNAIRCLPLQRAVGSSDLTRPPSAAVRDCARQLGERRDAYATADTVDDLEALRRALDDPRWVVGGISYGALVAQRYAIAYPAVTRGVVLDSVVPQEGAELLERVPMRATARVLQATCGDASAHCKGDPVADLKAVLDQHPELGPQLLDALTALSIGVPRLRVIPPRLHAAAAGDLGPLRRLLASARREQDVRPYLLSAGLHAATLCADSPAPWGGPDASEADRRAALDRLRTTLRASETAPFPPSTALRQGLLTTCRAWPPTPAPPALPRDARITAPALLLNGDRDLSTPLEWAREQAARMPHARLVVARGAGHSVLSRDVHAAGRAPLREFLSNLK